MKNNLVTGALILTFANIITKILGFIYRIYMSNVIGAEGIGLYQLILPLYSLAWSISSSGLSTTVSKLTAQENAKKQYGNMGRIVKQSVCIATTSGLVLGVLLFFFSDFVALYLLHDERTALPLQVLSFCFPFMAAGSCIRGYFYGLQHSEVPAISQVLEQFVRMGIIYILSGAFIAQGIEYACLAAVFGICLGEILSFAYVLYSYISFKRKKIPAKKPVASSMATLSAIAIMAVPLTANRVTGSLLSTVENILIPQRLNLYAGLTTSAMATYGQLTGMAMPLVMFPSSLLMALSITLVPAISEATSVKNKKRIQYTISKAMLFTGVTGIGATCLFLVFPHETAMLIFKEAEVGDLLFKIGLLCPLLYMQIIISGLLNGLGEQVFIFKNSLASSTIMIFSIYFLLPYLGVDGFIIGWFVSLLTTMSRSIYRITQRSKVTFRWKHWIAKPIFCGIIAGCSVKLLYLRMEHTAPVLLGLIILMYTIYLLLLIMTKCIIKEDIKIITRNV